MGESMTRLVLSIAILFAALAAPANAQAQPAIALLENLPQTGSHDYLMTLGYWDDKCIVAQASTRPDVVSSFVDL